MNILVIEDETVDRKLVEAVLSTCGHKVREGANAQDALAALGDELPDVILLDLHLPETDGIALARRIKTDPATRHIPILAITAYPERYPRDELLAAGCQACLSKPVDTRLLPRQIETIAGDGPAAQDDRACDC
jgi:CheY-like chemotaxis protein